jgi:hypothetical protein
MGRSPGTGGAAWDSGRSKNTLVSIHRAASMMLMSLQSELSLLNARTEAELRSTYNSARTKQGDLSTR